MKSKKVMIILLISIILVSIDSECKAKYVFECTKTVAEIIITS